VEISTSAIGTQDNSDRGIILRASRLVLGAGLLGLGAVAILLPLLGGVAKEQGVFFLGLLMLVGGLVYVTAAYITRDPKRHAYAVGGAISSIIAGVLLVAAGEIAFGAMAVLLGAWWMIDGTRLLAGVVGQSQRNKFALIFDGGVSFIIGLAIALQWPIDGAWAVFLAAGLRLLAGGWAMMLGQDGHTSASIDDRATHPDTALQLGPHERFKQLHDEFDSRDKARNPVHFYWISTLLLTFFVVHTARMEAAWNWVGLLSPAIAVVGDVLVSLVVTYLLILPARLVWRFVSRPLEGRLWTGRLSTQGLSNDPPQTARGKLVDFWLKRRFGFSRRVNQARRSPTRAVKLGLMHGLPACAVLVAVAPLLGISWFFNTEMWASGVWDQWAAHRTDRWRVAMTSSIQESLPTTQPFTIEASAIQPGQAFSFVVIGDPGEGDATQHILRDQLIQLSSRDDVKFLILSSDVIYPQGAMHDYEPKFYLPFKGWTKPIYAIPGNHDWYDALEAFAANFFTPEAARAAIRGRLDADNRISSTTDATIESYIQQAQLLRSEYRIQTGLQNGPYFELQTPHLAIVGLDSGVLRQLDEPQLAWFKDVLERSKGKSVMVIPGHPFYDAGHRSYDPEDDENYAQLHELLQQHDVRIVMAGDTHSFEVYRESANTLHFVNGGGGAYLSIGSMLDWPLQPATSDWALYPTKQQIVSKLDSHMSIWKRPLWWWTKTAGGWPASSETLASAFGSNRAPFHQSFALVSVDPARNTITVTPFGANGPLTWADLSTGGAIVPASASTGDVATFEVKMK
jgi:uncharacterized membrane protein HdeD (DUF308 family)/3',5'-cyclic AMP phosphodiesterase CpdA